ncbi:MAG: sugar transferase [Oscillospiraceae bacterium]|jgi:lipopolysaccharide/colanic/teichoic acid biosynthesis glycosyltransferase|nr:sugar transferase [Oscillospiraceae bacterium]
MWRYGPKGPALLECGKNQRDYLRRKRMLDVVLSLLALVALSPVLVAISLLIVIDDPRGGPIFCQKRVGERGRIFQMYKFRTMCVDAEARLKDLTLLNEMNGPVFKMRKDPRITRVGGFLRRTSLDELPQLINVLKGEMSLVGPRPPLPREVARYTRYERRRLSVTPGLTCYWQVRPDRYELSMNEWVELDLMYIQNRCLRLDWQLILQTVGAMVQGSGQ